MAASMRTARLEAATMCCDSMVENLQSGKPGYEGETWR